MGFLYRRRLNHLAVLLLLQLWSRVGRAQQCGSQAGGAVCSNNLCCSQFGYCGSTDAYCGSGCQSGPCSSGGGGGTPAPSGGGGGVSSIITSSIFDTFLNHRTDGSCPANGFYTYDAFITAAAAYSGFGTTGDATTQKRELAAFFAHAAHETSEGCYKEEINKQTYCSATAEWPCASGKQYYGRGPLQITWNYNYGPAGQAIGFDGINNPDIVASDAVTSFKTAIWYWMTQQSPTCHTIMINNQGFGATTNAINGGIECNQGSISAQQQDRINLYQSYCSDLGVDPGSNLSC